MTTVRYNGVVLHNIQTKEWVEEFVRDDSDTDAVFTRYRLRFQGIVHGQNIGKAPQWVSPESLSDIPNSPNAGNLMPVISRLLWQPRAALAVVGQTAAGGQETTLLSVSPSGSGQAGSDCENGPKPLDVRIEHIAGTSSFRVSFGIQCAIVESNTSEGATQPVLVNRWKIQETMDENYFMARTISGTMRLRSPVAATGKDFKWYCIPGLERGFKRTNIEFSVDKTGLIAEYVITDKQVKDAAPWPATKWSCRHEEGYNGLNQLNYSSMVVRLEAPPHIDKVLLFVRAVQIIDAKLAGKGMARDQCIPESAVFLDEIGDGNTVEVRMRLAYLSPFMPENWQKLRDETLGKEIKLPQLPGEPYPYDPMFSGPPSIFGYVPHRGERTPAAWFLLQCYLQRPDNKYHWIYNLGDPPSGSAGYPTAPSGGTSTGGGTSKGSGQDSIDTTSVKLYPDGKLPKSDSDSFSESAKQHSFTHAALHSAYLTNKCRVQLPIAGKGNPSDSGSGGTSTTGGTGNLSLVGDSPPAEGEVVTGGQPVLQTKTIAGHLSYFDPSLNAWEPFAIDRNGVYTYYNSTLGLWQLWYPPWELTGGDTFSMPVMSGSGGTGNTGSANTPGQSDDTCVILALSKGICRRVIEMDCERVGAWPEIMKPVDTYTDGTLRGTLLLFEVEPHAPTNPGNTLHYRVTARYWYALNRPPNDDEEFAVGVNPLTGFALKDTKFVPSKIYVKKLGPA